MPVEENLMQAILLTFGTAMVPVLELRGAIPVGVAAGLSPTGSGAPAFSAPGSTGWSAGLTCRAGWCGSTACRDSSFW